MNKPLPVTLMVGVLAASLGFGAATQANATTVSSTVNQTSVGELLEFSFTGLGASDGSGGSLTLDGNNLDLGVALDEFMDITIDTLSLGMWGCEGGGSDIPGAMGNTNCDFSLPLTISGGDLNAILADGSASIFVQLGPGTQVFGTSLLTATLSYTDAAPVPLPAGLPLLVAGLGAFGWMRRRARKPM